MKMQTILHVVEIPNSMWANILLNERNELIKTAKTNEPNASDRAQFEYVSERNGGLQSKSTISHL